MLVGEGIVTGTLFAGKLEAVAPCLDAVGFDFQIKPVPVGQLIWFRLWLGTAAFGIGQHWGEGSGYFGAVPGSFNRVLAAYPATYPVILRMSTNEPGQP